MIKQEAIDAETWKDIVGYESVYQISNFGRVKRLGTTLMYKGKYPRNWKEKIISQNKTNSGYKKCRLSKEGKTKTHNIHRLVAKSFISNPLDLPCVNHIDGNKENNASSNLEWCTHKENSQHALDTGLMAKYGEKTANAKLKNADVTKIKELYLNGKFNQYQLADMFGVTQPTIGNAIRGDTYKNVHVDFAVEVTD